MSLIYLELFYQVVMPYSLKILLLLIKQCNPAPNRRFYNYIFGVIFVAIIISSFYLFKSALLLLLLMIFVSLIPIFNLILPNIKFLHNHNTLIIEHYISFLTKSGLLKYFYFVYHFWYNCLTLKGFKFFTVLLGMSFLYNLIVVRYIFYLKIANQIIPFYFYFLYLLGILCLFLRFITNFSTFIIPFVFLNYPKYGHIMLTEIPDIEDLKNKPRTPLYPQYRGLFNYHNHKHNYPPEFPRSVFSNNFNRFCLVSGLCLSTYACYHYRLQALAAIKAADAAVRAADAAEVQAGLMTKDDFQRRHPK